MAPTLEEKRTNLKVTTTDALHLTKAEQNWDGKVIRSGKERGPPFKFSSDMTTGRDEHLVANQARPPRPHQPNYGDVCCSWLDQQKGKVEETRSFLGNWVPLASVSVALASANGTASLKAPFFKR